MYDRRFASLRGHSRSLLDDFDDLELEPPEDALFDDELELHEDLDLDAVFGEPAHDGWSELVPLYERMQDVAIREHLRFDLG